MTIVCASADLVGRGARQLVATCYPRQVFDFLFVFIYVIGTYMQIFKKIDRQKNHTSFILKFGALFVCQTVQGFQRLVSHLGAVYPA